MVVPLESDTTEEFGIPVDGDAFVVLFEDVNEVLCVFFADVVDGKVIHDKRKGDRTESV